MIKENLLNIMATLPEQVTLVAVSKTKPAADLLEAYAGGQRIFGENKVQEMAEKFEQLPKDIEWHMIGHLQTNKVKYLAPFVNLIHGVDSLKLLAEINKQALKNSRIIDCLFQMHIAEEETKFGLNESELEDIVKSDAIANFNNICIKGLMGMATFTDDEQQIKKEFTHLKSVFEQMKNLPKSHNLKPEILSMGMSGDYQIAIDCGSTMVRVGSSIFGGR